MTQPKEKKERKDRKVHSMLGLGTLVWEVDGFWMRFEPDEGKPLRFEWGMISKGTPEYVKRSKRRRDLLPTAEEDRWMTIETRAGEVLTFCDPDLPQPAAPSAVQLALIS